MRVIALGGSLYAGGVLSCFIAYLAINRAMPFALHVLACLAINLLALFLLSLTNTPVRISDGRSNTPLSSKAEQQTSGSQLTILIRITGIFGASYYLLLDYLYPDSNPFALCFIRVTSFFLACKLLNLTLARGSHPPKRMVDGKVVALTDWKTRLDYIRRLFFENRYLSFDIAVREKGREQSASKIWTYAPPAAITILAIIFPSVEISALLGLVAISVGLELEHMMLHPGCPHPLFYQPFAATSISAFWSTHWHQGAYSWLYSLGYVPAKRLVTPLFGPQAGRAAGILNTFSLSGIWHGWCAAAMTTRPWRTGLSLWALFVGQGVACLIEQAVWRERQGGMLQRVLAWTISLLALSAFIRDAKEFTKVPELARFI